MELEGEQPAEISSRKANRLENAQFIQTKEYGSTKQALKAAQGSNGSEKEKAGCRGIPAQGTTENSRKNGNVSR